MLINGLHIRIIHATTGQLIRELILNPAVDYQPRGVRKPRPKPSYGFEVSRQWISSCQDRLAAMSPPTFPWRRPLALAPAT